MQKLAINLLQAELLPSQPLWTLKRVVLVWFLTLALMFAWMSVEQYQLTQLSEQLKTANTQKQENDTQLATLEQKVRQNKADALLQEKLATVKLLLANKKLLHDQLTDVSTTYTAGFSRAMSELSQLHHKDISLQKIKMNPQQMLFSGLAKTPDAVPVWLAAFENSTFLSGQTFKHFSLSENENNVIHFTVSSQVNTDRRAGE